MTFCICFCCDPQCLTKTEFQNQPIIVAEILPHMRVRSTKAWCLCEPYPKRTHILHMSKYMQHLCNGQCWKKCSISHIHTEEQSGWPWETTVNCEQRPYIWSLLCNATVILLKKIFSSTSLLYFFLNLLTKKLCINQENNARCYRFFFFFPAEHLF